MKTTRLDGHDAGSRGVIQQTVILFAQPQIGHHRVQPHQGQFVRREIDLPLGDELSQRLEFSNRGRAFTSVEQFISILVACGCYLARCRSVLSLSLQQFL